MLFSTKVVRHPLIKPLRSRNRCKVQGLLIFCLCGSFP